MSNSERDNQAEGSSAPDNRRHRGFELPSDQRNERFDSAPRAPQDGLMRRLMTLQRLHPNVVRFREADLEQMDRSTLEDLLEDFSEALGIRSNVPSCL